MASKKHLKKNIQTITSELVSYLYVKRFVIEDLTEEKFFEAARKVVTLNNEFLNRANHPNGADNPKIIKTYYAQLVTDFNSQMAEICELIEPKKKA